MRDGEGVFVWASGNIYKGQYHKDERNGYGRMEWTDGSAYEGEWKNGIQHGMGKMTFPDGTIKEGVFENNVFKQDLAKTPDLPHIHKNSLAIIAPPFDQHGPSPRHHLSRSTKSSSVFYKS